MRQLFGAKIASRMLPFDSERAGARVCGLATISQESYPTPRMVFTFVNGRAVRDRVLARAVTQAYETLIPRGRYPAVAAVRRDAPRRGRRQRSSDEDRGALSQLGRGFRDGLSCACAHGSPIRPIDVRRSADAAAADASPPDAAAAPIAASDSALGRHASAPPGARRAGARARRATRAGSGRAGSETDFEHRGLSRRAGTGGGDDGGAAKCAKSRPARRYRIETGSSGRYRCTRGCGSSARFSPAISRSRATTDCILVDQHAAHERVTFEKLRARAARRRHPGAGDADAGADRAESRARPASASRRWPSFARWASSSNRSGRPRCCSRARPRSSAPKAARGCSPR